MALLLDEPHLAAAARFVAQNPVRAGLASAAAYRRWSSVHAHLSGDPDPDATNRLRRAAPRRAESIGGPLADKTFLQEIEARTKRTVRPAKRGPKPRTERNEADQRTLI